MAKVGASLVFDDVYEIIRTNYGVNSELVAKIILNGLFGGFTIGYHWVSIIIKVYLITLFSIFESKKLSDGNVSSTYIFKNIFFWKWNWNTIINVSTEFNFLKIENNNFTIEWQPNKEWFSDINKNNLLLVDKKYNQDLHIKSSVEENILLSIKLSHDQLDILKNKVTEALDSTNNLETEIDELFKVNSKQDILKLNEGSDIYIEFNELKDSLNDFTKELQSLNNLIDENIGEEIKNYEIPNLSDLSFTADRINQIINDNRYNLLIKKLNDSIPLSIPQKRDVYNLVYPTYRAYENVKNLISKVEIIRNKIFDNFYLIQAKAGVGKTHFSISLKKALSEENFKTIFINGSSFSGYNNLQSAFKTILELPDSITFESALIKLNEFSEKRNTKTVIIIDGINETTNLLQGFSTIWNDNLIDLCNRIHQYNNLVLVITCRETYLKKMNIHTVLSKNIFQLQGFESDSKRLKAIECYFEHYKIICNGVRIENPKLDFFELPLILGIFCEMTNPDKKDPKLIRLGQFTYEEVLKLFVDKQSEKVAEVLDRPSKTAILNAIDRSSEEFKDVIEATMDFDHFLSVTDNKLIDDIFKSKSIGIKLLEEELLFIKEYIEGFEEERIKHTFQNIGGYLIAKNILNTYRKAQDLVDSDYYNTFLKFSEFDDDKKSHQLVTDILKFLVTGYSRRKDDLINHTNDQLIINYTWEFLFENPEFEEKEDLERKLKPFLRNRSGWQGLLNKSIQFFVKPKSSFNMVFISGQLKQLPQFQFDLIWSKFVFDRWYSWDEFLDSFFEDNAKIEDNKVEIINLKLELIIWLLETTFNKIRDKATAVLLEYSTNNPKFIFEKVFEFSISNRPYVYERLTAICYGVCLRKQNDEKFINGILKEHIGAVYKLQFGQEPSAPTYNYLVIDSLKHIVDLSVHKEIFNLEERELYLLNNYKFLTNEPWNDLTEEDFDIVRSISQNWSLAGTDPLRGDFVHYTIPRLLDRFSEGSPDRLIATANIYRRLIEVGYITEDQFEASEKQDNEFYYGNKPYGFEGKMDRLGKKYSWIAFFDYAGFLINEGKLNCWLENDGDSSDRVYKRLGDVELEVSNPIPVLYSQRLFKINLLKFQNNNPSWTKRSFYQETKRIWKQSLDDTNFTLLNAYLEQKPNNNYDVRSFLLINSILVKKKDIENRILDIENKEFDWHYDLDNISSLYQVYFGELYWADSIPNEGITERAIPTSNKDGKINRYIYNTESTTSEYLWESNSEIYKTLRGSIPSPNIGKYLELKADAENFQILDKYGNLAFKSFEYNDQDLIKQDLDYLRTDLLEKYMTENGLVLMYQIKQHTYDRLAGDGTGDFRGMQFFFPNLS